MRGETSPKVNFICGAFNDITNDLTIVVFGWLALASRTWHAGLGLVLGLNSEDVGFGIGLAHCCLFGLIVHC